jgi:Xaa-Pro aminopeptidase
VIEDQRIETFCVKMNEMNLEYLVAYFEGSHSFLEQNLVFLLSDFKSMGESLIMLHVSGASTLIATPSWDAKRAKENSKSKDVIATDDLIGTFNGVLESRKIDLKKVGFIGFNSMKQSAFSKFSNIFNDAFNFYDEDFLKLTSCKSEQEIERAKKATWIAERGYEKMLEAAKPGIYEYQLAGELDSFMKSLGADDNFLLLSASQHNQAVRPPGRRRLEKGDIILGEISPSYEGQFIQICRSVVLGDVNKDDLFEKYQLLIAAFDRGVSAAKAGEKMSNVIRAINEPLETAGYGDYCRPPYMRVRGHGLGLSTILPGDVSVDNDITLKEGMLFIIHPNQYLPETGYLLCGETVIITSAGAIPLTNRRPSLDIIDI